MKITIIWDRFVLVDITRVFADRGSFPSIFSRVHATLHLAVSVGRSVGRSVRPSVTFLNSEHFLHYCSCPTVRDWIAVYPALLFLDLTVPAHMV